MTLVFSLFNYLTNIFMSDLIGNIIGGMDL